MKSSKANRTVLRGWCEECHQHLPPGEDMTGPAVLLHRNFGRVHRCANSLEAAKMVQRENGNTFLVTGPGVWTLWESAAAAERGDLVGLVAIIYLDLREWNFDVRARETLAIVRSCSEAAVNGRAS